MGWVKQTFLKELCKVHTVSGMAKDNNEYFLLSDPSIGV